MHILLYHFYSRTPNPVYQEIAANLRELGHTVWLGSRNQDDNLEWHDGAKTVSVIAGPYRELDKPSSATKFLAPLRNLQYMLRVRAFVADAQPDIFQANVNNLAWVLPLFNRGKTAFLYDIRQINEAVNRSLRQRLMEKRTIWTMMVCARLFYKHTFFCHKEAAKKILGEQWTRNSSVIPVGIDKKFLELSSLEEVSDAEHAANGSGPIASKDASKVRFLYVGTLSRLRNLDKLIRAAQSVSTKSIDFQLDLVGPDTTGGYYQNLVTELALENVVAVKPPVAYHEIPEIMSSYDVGLAYVPDRPTWHYQPTIKALEYRALGLPMISTDVATHREIIDEDRNGMLVSDDVASLAASMMRYVEDEPFLRKCQENAIEMRQGTTWLQVAQMYADAYQKCLS